jgi:hypothetical protein
MTALIFIRSGLNYSFIKLLISLHGIKGSKTQNTQIMSTFSSWSGRIFRRALRPLYFVEKGLFASGMVSSQKMILPDFLCIGVQKAGTSWLHENLRSQSEIFVPEKKELDYFGNPHRFYGSALSHYSDYFKPGKSKIKGEASPYCDIPLSRVRFMGKIMPHTKLIIILRNPVDRIWSAGLMHLVRARQQKFEEISTEVFMRFLEKKEIFNQGLYPEILKKWRSVFPSEQLLICFYEDLEDNPELFLKHVLNFLGATYQPNSHVREHVNKSPNHPMPALVRNHFLELYKPSILELSEEFGDKALRWLRN